MANSRASTSLAAKFVSCWPEFPGRRIMTTTEHPDHGIDAPIGNIIGGGALVGGVYWFIYLRRR